MIPENLPYHLLPLVVVPVMLVASGLYATWWWRRHRDRHRRLADWAAEHQLRHFPEDPFGLARLGMPLFAQLGRHLTFANVLLGEWSGLPFKAAELTSYTRVLNSNGQFELSEQASYSILVAELDVRLRAPTVVIEPERLLTKAKGALGMPDIQFESGEFNARFHIQSEDRRFAYQLIDARMMHHLLSVPDSRLRYEIHGSRLLVSLPRDQDNVIVTDVFPLFAAARGLAERIPRVVWSEHAAGAAAARTGGR